MSKAFAEELIYKYGFKLPVAIVRPSIIIGAFAEPEVGYVQGYQVIIVQFKCCGFDQNKIKRLFSASGHASKTYVMARM